ncbi:hypothetical protein [Nonomuraea africana]|uniref:Tetrahydromethanopterin S-methyltransferase subunit B n=1 Tax=Nonomuraea africana TaxID=46171 RepID=A0ABR9KJ41_9ACTN|nr:hypothetical protein [Nonomuraea africana]MBE1562025.1 tetrahydromethanopterin S-methyltransferase subunit B [Nonomuraea africana]
MDQRQGVLVEGRSGVVLVDVLPLDEQALQDEAALWRRGEL